MYALITLSWWPTKFYILKLDSNTVAPVRSEIKNHMCRAWIYDFSLPSISSASSKRPLNRVVTFQVFYAERLFMISPISHLKSTCQDTLTNTSGLAELKPSLIIRGTARNLWMYFSISTNFRSFNWPSPGHDPWSQRVYGWLTPLWLAELNAKGWRET